MCMHGWRGSVLVPVFLGQTVRAMKQYIAVGLKNIAFRSDTA